MLPDGRVVVIGGEYIAGFCPNPPDHCGVWTDIGFMYDPMSNSWSEQISEPFGGGNIGDAQSTILPNGTMLLADVLGSRDIASFSPNADPPTFTALDSRNKADSNDQENWNILPDGRVLTVNAWIQTSFQIYNPATMSWGTARSTMVNLADTGPGTLDTREVGPVVLRPDGTLIAFSGTNSGQNAVYNTATDMWAATGAAGDFPPFGPGGAHYAVADGPASLLPNGNVLVMASPVYPTDPPGIFNTPSRFFEFDGTNLTPVADSDHADSFFSYQGRMLLLPSGQVLLTAYNGAIQDVMLYSNGGAPQDAWRPVITTAPSQVVAGNTYSISGTLFNGFSEGASYGDDAQMSTNYPLVRIEYANGHKILRSDPPPQQDGR